MKNVISLILAIFILNPLGAQNPVSVYISFYDRQVMQTENVCRDLLFFRKEFKDNYPEAKVYPYILPKPVMEIEFARHV